ncbi:MAG: hypothetical protein IPL49_18130 [Saprospirales bacterium]|nr:hypothetical protein [Saprospirales bacterium]MBK8492745.1 hypothetical protein [Saprospirales bacterium]
MDEISVKFGLLDPIKRQEILDFLDFLLSKQKKERAGSFKSYKEQILQVSTWSEEDISAVQTNSKKLSQWQAPEW